MSGDEPTGGGTPDVIRRDDDGRPIVVNDSDGAARRLFVTSLKTVEQQVGEHILNALSDKDTVAVLTTTVAGIDGGPRVFSAGLDPAMLEEVQRLLSVAEAGRQEEVPCLGFHCFVRPREEAE